MALIVASCGDSASDEAQTADAASQTESQTQSESASESASASASEGADQAQDPAGPSDTRADQTPADELDDDTADTASERATDVDNNDKDGDGSQDEDEGESGDGDGSQDGDQLEPIVDPLLPSERGDKGDEVKRLQQRLFDLGMGPGTPDGSYGRRTEAAVAAFQGLVEIEPTGVADAETVEALDRYRYDGLVLFAGDEGDDVETLQQRLADGPFDPGPIDGEYGTATVQAVWALEKLAELPVDGNWGPLEEQAWEKLTSGDLAAAEKSNELRWVEVDLSQQIIKVYDPDQVAPVLISHVSSGSGIPWENEEFSGSSVTPLGDFHIDRRISGWRESSLNIGRLYNPLYFNGGIAFHGASSVPNYPASHGCVRVPMHIAEYLPDELPNGTPVHVLP
jgi:peptidoglycan hydrolase-like protein with peptidoglycan-binding domain